MYYLTKLKYIMLRTFKISHELFQGYTVNLNIEKTYSVLYIAELVKINLLQILTQLNLHILTEKANVIIFHLDCTIDYICQNPENIFWVCSHKHN